jgi:drug/metabolite transporter (DMT)-like permease
VLLGVACLGFSASYYGAFSVLTKSLYSYGLDPLTLLFARTAPAAVILWLYIILTRRPIRPTLRSLLLFGELGVLGLGLSSWCYFQALRYLPASMAVMIMYVHPSLVAVLSAYLYRDRLTAQRLLALGFRLAGCGLLVGIYDPHNLIINATGIFFALGAVLGCVVYALVSYKGVREYPEDVVATYVATFSTVMFLTLQNPVDLLDIQLPSTGWAILLAIAVLPQVLAILLYLKGVKILGPGQTVILMTLEPLVATSLAFMVLGERMSPPQLVGGIMVLGGMLLSQLRLSLRPALEIQRTASQQAGALTKVDLGTPDRPGYVESRRAIEP